MTDDRRFIIIIIDDPLPSNELPGASKRRRAAVVRWLFEQGLIAVLLAEPRRFYVATELGKRSLAAWHK